MNEVSAGGTTPVTQSEIVQLLAQIDAETEAVQRGLSGLACVASHAIITARTEMLARRYTDSLRKLITPSVKTPALQAWG
jgi:hypothetical protein